MTAGGLCKLSHSVVHGLYQTPKTQFLQSILCTHDPLSPPHVPQGPLCGSSNLPYMPLTSILHMSEICENYS